MERWLIRGSGGHFEGWWAEGSTILWSGVLRMAQTFAEALPFVIVGMLSAGILRGMVGPERLRGMLGVGRWTGPIRAWGLGLLLPICALGALPVALELRRARIPSGTVISFVLVAPLLNPVSIVYGLSHVEPVTLLYFAAGTFVISTGIGAIWNRLISRRWDQAMSVDEAVPASGSGRLLASGMTACQVLLGPVLVDFLLVLLVMGFLGAFLPYGVLQTAFTRDNPLAPLLMACVAIPVYVTPMEVMVQFEHIVRDGYSLAAAFALIVLGAGANVGVANWLRRDYGWRALGFFSLMLLVSTLGIAALADRSLTSDSTIMKDHTHAFDSYTRLPSGSTYGPGYVYEEVRREMLPSQQWALSAFGVMTLTGLVLRRRGGQYERRIRRWIAVLDQAVEGRGLNRALSTRTVLVIGAAFSVGFGTVLAYVYYPPAPTLLRDIAAVRTELYESVINEDRLACHRRIHQLDALMAKFPVSQLLRHGGFSEAQAACQKEWVERLDVLREFLIREDFAAARTVLRYVEQGHLQFLKALGDGSHPGISDRTAPPGATPAPGSGVEDSEP
jgi:uncharacterized membrane protein YraQ (UPF0718 family)